MVKPSLNDDLKPLPAPGPRDTLGNAQTKRIRVKDGRKRRPQKGLVQFAVKVRSRVRDRFEAAFEAARDAADGNLTKGDFMDMVLAGYEAQAAGADLAATAAAVTRDPVPSKQDRDDGRTIALSVFATRPLAKALNQRAKANDWTLSETVEHACAQAKHIDHLEQQLAGPCPHCGKGIRDQV